MVKQTQLDLTDAERQHYLDESITQHPTNTIEIWAPRYKDRVALIAKHKVVSGVNRIIFTKAKHLKDKEFHLHSEVITRSPSDTNGTIACYAVPMSEIENGYVIEG